MLQPPNPLQAFFPLQEWALPAFSRGIPSSFARFSICLSLMAQPPWPLHALSPRHLALASTVSAATFFPNAESLRAQPPDPLQAFLLLQPDFSVRVPSAGFEPVSACAGAADTRPAVMPAMASWVSIVVFFMGHPSGIRVGYRAKLQSRGRRTGECPPCAAFGREDAKARGAARGLPAPGAREAQYPRLGDNHFSA